MIKNRNILKVIFSILYIIIISLNQIIFAVDFSEINKININQNLGEYRIYSRIGADKYIYYDGRLQTNFEYYYLDKNGKEMPAYCLELGIDGAETKDEYYVNVSDKIKDEKVSSIILNGYPYKSITELGVANVTEAKYATQFAIWSYISNLDISKITPVIPEYNRVLNAINKIYNNGINCIYNSNNLVKIENTKMNVDSVDKNFFSTTISLKYNENVKDIYIKLDGISEYKITDEYNKELFDLHNINKLKILIPRNSVLKDTKIDVKVSYNTLQTAILFGKAKIPNMQNVALILEPTILKNLCDSFELKYIPVNLKIVKCDKENNKIKLSNVKFKIYNMEEKLLGEYITDENGEINLDILKEFNIKNGEKIKIVEVETLNEYYIDCNAAEQILEINYDKENTAIFENEKIKGKIKIIKTSSDYNENNNYNVGTFLKDAVFEIYDENNNLVQEIITNEYGQAYSKELLKGKYYIKEKKAPKHYVLDKKIYELEIKEHNELVILNLKNSSKKMVELPKTGF